MYGVPSLCSVSLVTLSLFPHKLFFFLFFHGWPGLVSNTTDPPYLTFSKDL